MARFFKALYVRNLFFYICLGIVVLFVISYFFPAVFGVAKLLLWVLFVFALLDILIIFSTWRGITARRELPEKLSNGDQNPIDVTIENYYTFVVYATLIDEIPEQFQVRNFRERKKLMASSVTELRYKLRPVERGEYHFGKLNVYISSFLGLIARRFIFYDKAMVPTYPSFLQLRRYELMAIHNNLHQYGIKKIRRIGHTMEFEKIKEYVIGDDIRTLNWKATAKKGQLMVNQFQDERAQPVYSIIDKGRVMKMPFNGMSLLDHAINATLVISNVVLRKQDKAGMFTFSKRVENRVAAERRSAQMGLILESLYNVETDFFESDFSRLYVEIKRNITQRSLLLLYTNFETMDGLHRQLTYLKGIARNHLLVVIFFKNTEMDTMLTTPAATVQEIYDKIVAEKFAFEKRLIVNELKKYGIYSILATPEHLTIDTVNKYLEIKARGLF